MNTNPSDRPGRQVHDLRLTSEQIMLAWQLTEMASPANGSAADLLSSLRNRLRPEVAKIKRAFEAPQGNGSRKPEMVSDGRGP